MNQVNLFGRLGKDVELKYTANGKAVASISLATSEKRKDKEITEWHKIIVWDKLAENCNQYLSKGSQALITGKIQTRSYNDKNNIKRYTTEIIASNVQFIFAQPPQQNNTRDTSRQQQNHSNNNQGQQQNNNGYQQSFTADDIPF